MYRAAGVDHVKDMDFNRIQGRMIALWLETAWCTVCVHKGKKMMPG
jgi:hypothetical protein